MRSAIAIPRAIKSGFAGCARNMLRRRREQGWESVGHRTRAAAAFRVPPGMPSVDPSALVLMRIATRRGCYNPARMEITKLDAARRQIDAAIKLYFEEGDEVAVHTLVGAAHILITDLGAAAKQESILDRYVVREKRWEVEGAIRAPQNFLKHATRDPEATFDFNPHSTELMLFIDIEMFKELTGSATDGMRAFHAYAGATWGKAAFAAFPDFTALAAQVSKREFFACCLGLIARGRDAGLHSE